MDSLELVSKIEQLRDIWTGRESYDTDEEWLDNVEWMIGEICELTGVDTAAFPILAPREE